MTAIEALKEVREEIEELEVSDYINEEGKLYYLHGFIQKMIYQIKHDEITTSIKESTEER